MDNDELCALWDQGLYIGKIAEKFGVSIDRVRWRVRDLQRIGRIKPRWKGNHGRWSPHRVERLRERFLQGEGATSIAAELGPEFSRNMIAGKIWRLGLKRGEGANQNGFHGGAASPTIVRPSGMKVVKRKVLREQAREQARVLGVHLPPLHIELPADSSPNPVGIFDLRRCHCRWPLSSGLYCGEQVRTATSWCPRHYSMVFRGFKK